MLGVLDQIDAVADRTFAALKQFTTGQRQLMSMFGGMMQVPTNGTTQAIAAPVAALPAASPTTDDESGRGVPDASAILAKKKKPAAAKKPGAKRGGRKPAAAPAAATEGAAPAGEATGADETAEAEPGQPSLRSVVWSILTRPENMEKGLRAGGDGPSVLKVILDEKAWVSKKNGNMPALISQCLNTLKRDGKITRDSETHCFIAKPGVTLD
jgi:hypothetical protein